MALARSGQSITDSPAIGLRHCHSVYQACLTGDKFDVALTAALAYIASVRSFTPWVSSHFGRHCANSLFDICSERALEFKFISIIAMEVRMLERVAPLLPFDDFGFL